MTDLIEARNLSFSYKPTRHADPGPGEWVLRDVSFAVGESDSLGIVGESGSGKSTLVRILCGLLPLRHGEASFAGRSIPAWIEESPKLYKTKNQIVFQSPANSLDPKMRVRRSVAEPVKSLQDRSPSTDELHSWLERVGLSPEMLSRYPHELSGGQLQRVAIARALSVSPQCLYADEPTSALDVSIQAQVLNLLMDLRDELGLTLVMVSHDLAVVSRICESIVVLKDGEVVESGSTRDVLRNPQTAYTASLIEAADAVSLDV